MLPPAVALNEFKVNSRQPVLLVDEVLKQ